MEFMYTNKCHCQQDPVTVLHGTPSHQKGGGDLEDEHPREGDVQSRELDEVGDIPARRWVQRPADNSVERKPPLRFNGKKVRIPTCTIELQVLKLP